MNERGPKPGIDFETTDLGDTTESGAEIMYRLKQQELERQRHMSELDDTFADDSKNDTPKRK